MTYTTHTLNLRDGEVVVRFWYVPQVNMVWGQTMEDAEEGDEGVFDWEIVSTTADFSEEDWMDEDEQEIEDQLREIVNLKQC